MNSVPPFPSVSLRRQCCHLQATRGTLLSLVLKWYITTFEPCRSQSDWRYSRWHSLSLCFHRRPRQPHLQEGNAEEDLRRRYVSQYSVEVFLSQLNYDRYDWLQGNAAYLSFLPPYSTLITAATLVFAGSLFSHTIQQVACNNKATF